METKICKNDFFSDNEIETGEILKLLPNYQDYFLLVKKKSKIILSNTAFDIDGQEEEKTDDLDYILLEYEKPKDHKSACSYDNFEFFMYDIFTSYKYLLNTLQILLNNDIYHLNITESAVYFNKKKMSDLILYTSMPLLTQFNKSLCEPISKDLKEMVQNDTIDAISIYMPLELKLIYYLEHNNHLKFMREQYEEFYIKYIYPTRFEIFSEEFSMKYNILCYHYLTNYLNNTTFVIYDKVLKGKHTWDNYSLSVLYLHEMNKYLKNEYPDNKTLHELSQLLLTNIHPNFNQRLDIPKTLDCLNNLKV